MSTESSRVARERPRHDAGRLWVGLVAPPLVFLMHLQAAYALAPLACRQGHSLSLHIASVVAIVLAIAFGLLSLAGWRRSGREWPDSSGSAATRDRFLGAVGALSVVLVVLTLIAQWIPVFAIDPCR